VAKNALKNGSHQCIHRVYPSPPSPWQSKKRQYDQEVENLERQQKQTIERLEQEHTTRPRDEARRIKAEQDKELSKHQNALKNRKKEVRPRRRTHLHGDVVVTCSLKCPR